MDLWIKKESERSVAGVAAVLAFLLPWDVTYISDIAGGSLVYFRFPFWEFQWAGGIQGAEPFTFRVLNQAWDLRRGAPLEPAYDANVVGALFVALGVLLAIGLFVSEPRDGGVNPTRVVGGLLALGGVSFLVGWWFLVTRGAAGIDIPLGATLTTALGAVLVLADREESG